MEFRTLSFRHSGSRLSLLLTLSILGQCFGHGASAQERVLTTDSAGIELVFSRGPKLAGGDAWYLSAGPVLQIGKADGAEPFLFGNLWGATECADGTIVLAEGQSHELRVFSAEGEHLRTFGGRGNGPSEFRGPPWVTTAGSDTVVVWDPGIYRLTWFDLEGNLLRERALRSVVTALPISMFPRGNVWQFRQGGALLSIGPGNLGFGPGIRRSTRRVVLIDDAGETVHDFGEVTAGLSVSKSSGGGRPTNVGSPFGPAVWPALGPSPLSVALGGDGAWEVQWLDSEGQIVRISRADIPRVYLSRELIGRERDRLRERVNQTTTLGQLQSAFDDLPLPDSVPAIGAMRFDRSGNLWVKRRRPSKEDGAAYDVLGPDGDWLTSITIPAEIERIFEIGEDHLLGLWRDQMDVPYLRVYQLLKPEGPS